MEDWLIGSALFPVRLIGEVYRCFLKETLPHFLKDVPLTTIVVISFMHHDARAHFSLVARDFSTLMYIKHRISLGGLQARLGRALNLHLQDFPLWENLNSLVHTSPLENFYDLRNQMIAGCNSIGNDPDFFKTVPQTITIRLSACIHAGESII